MERGNALIEKLKSCLDLFLRVGGRGLSFTAVLALAGIQRIVLPNLFGGSAVINPATNIENIKSLLSMYLRTSKRLRDQGGSGNDLTWLSL